MNFKQVYLYDGTPFLAFVNEDGEYEYPKDEWTETPPPEGIYIVHSILMVTIGSVVLKRNGNLVKQMKKKMFLVLTTF